MCLYYFLVYIEYSTQTATRPTSPWAEKPAMMFCTLPITEISGQNGIDCSAKSTSSTIPRAISETPTSDNALTYAFILLIASI